MRAARRSTFLLFLSALACSVALSCGSDSTGPGGGNGVTISPNPDTVALGSTSTLHATVDGATGNPSIFWSSEDTTIATVSGSGVVTGVAVGTAHIAASSGGKSGIATVVVRPPGVASVQLAPTSAVITVGGVIHLQAKALDASGNELAGRTITWTSSNDAVATVDNTGLVTGVATGADTITATSEGKSATAGIAVSSAVPASIAVAPTSVTVTAGQTSQLTATVKDANGSVISGAPVTWSVDKPAVAIVGSTGLVSGQAAGTATVTATSGSVHVDVPVTVTLPPANAVVVSPSTVSLLVTERQQLTGTVTDANGNAIPGQTITWTSSNSAVAAVGTTGLVIAVAPGTATITATSGSVHGTADVTVSLVPVRRVTLTPDALSFTEGDQGTQLTVALLDSAGGTLSQSGRTLNWSSSNSAVASVNGTGFVTPGAPGQAVITASLAGTGLSATATVTVTRVPVASVVVAPSLDTLVVLAQLQLTATPQDAAGHPLAGRTITWDGSDDNIATVSSNGRVTALSPGSMTVSATAGGKTGTATIVVIQAPVASVELSPTTQSVVVGQTTPAFTAVTKDAAGHVLTGRTVTFNSDNTGVATIDQTSGVATGVSQGTAQITATSEGITSNAATLTVNPAPVGSVTVNPSTQTITDGSTATFNATVKDGQGNQLTGRTVSWDSSDHAVATIDNSGLATSTGPGNTNITATSEGKSGTASLQVDLAPVTSVAVTPPFDTTNVGSTVQLSASVQGTDAGHRPPATWSSADNAIATVDGHGRVTGVAPGDVAISATVQGISGSAQVTVLPLP
jgi:trimeric autotransporter adhesin